MNRSPGPLGISARPVALIEGGLKQQVLCWFGSIMLVQSRSRIQNNLRIYIWCIFALLCQNQNLPINFALETFRLVRPISIEQRVLVVPSCLFKGQWVPPSSTHLAPLILHPNPQFPLIGNSRTPLKNIMDWVQAQYVTLLLVTVLLSAADL